MHIAEGFLPPVQAAVWTVVAAPFIVHGARAVIKTVREHPDAKLLLAASGAFTFVLSAIKLPSVTGSSSHPTGTGVGAILFKPPVMAFLGSIVLLFQALLLAHGGITTLGANTFSMAIVGPWCGYAMWVLLRKASFSVRVFAVMFVSDLMTYVVTAIQLAIAHPVDGYVASAEKFLGVFAVTQIPLAIVEGLVGVLLFNLLRKWAGPELRNLGVLRGVEELALADSNTQGGDR